MLRQNMQIIKPIIREIDKTETLRYAGLSRNKEWQPQLLQAACTELLLVAQPVCIYTIMEHTCGQIESYRYTSSGLERHLKGCKQVVVLSATLGMAVDERIAELFAKDEYTQGLLLNAAATALIEQTADYLTEYLFRTKFAKLGQQLGARFSPGYSDWPLEAQREFFPLTLGDKIGIELTAGCSLNPKKSITAVMPILDNAAEQKNCTACVKLDCEYRQS